MMTKILKWGNSLGLRIPKSFAQQLEIGPDSKVDIVVRDGHLLVRPVPRPKYTLDQLLSEVTQDNLHDEADFGDPVGRESF